MRKISGLGLAQEVGVGGVGPAVPASLPRGSGQTLMVVDDDPGVVELVETTLALSGYSVVTAADGEHALALQAETQPALMILDIMMPGLDGFEVLRALSDRGSRTPVLFLTARDAVADRVNGLVLGADDYLTKPFSVPELLARVHALLRRAAGGGNGAEAGSGVESDVVLRFSDLTLDERTLRVHRGERLLALSPTEFTLLRYLLVNPDQVLSKGQIMDYVWQHRFDDGVVEKLVSRLRAKVDAHPPHLIQTVRGFGYSLRLQPQA